MIPHTQQHVVEASPHTATEFQISNSAKMFAILADKIYTDKPRAVIREICCNALDTGAHFNISLPSYLDPTLSIRDFGSGMSHEEMMEFYTQVFYSTKSDDNSQIGGFGLGRMSIFSYTDAFTVVCIQGHKKRVYAVYRNEHGVPAVTLADTQITDEEDGFEVKIPIKQDDFNTFCIKAQEVLRWFPPESFTCFGADIQSVEWLVKTEHWGISKETIYKPTALMGPVAYELNWHDHDEISKRIVPFFPIGSMDLSPGREQFSYNPATLENLAVMAARVKTEAKDAILAMINAHRSRWERISAAKELNELLPQKERIEAFIYLTGTLVERSRRGERKVKSRGHREKQIIYPNHKFPIVYMDVSDKPYIRLSADPTRQREYILISKEDFPTLGHLIAVFGKRLPIIRLLSEYELPAAVPRMKQSYQLTIWEVYRGQFNRNSGVYSGGIWWPFNNASPEHASKFKRLSELKVVSSETILGLSKTAQRQIDTSSEDFVRLDDWVKQRVAELDTEETRADLLRSYIAAEISKTHNRHINTLSTRDDFGAGLWPMLEPIRQLYAPANLSTINNLVDNGFIRPPKDPTLKQVKRYTDLLDRAFATKPLLELALDRGGNILTHPAAGKLR